MKKMLVVDDSRFMRSIIKNTIKDSGFDIEIIGEASNGIEAIEKFKKLKPDIITLDITMDRKNGIDTLKEIKAINKSTKVIMISAMGQHAFILESIKLGASDFVVKPFDIEKVKFALDKALNY